MTWLSASVCGMPQVVEQLDAQAATSHIEELNWDRAAAIVSGAVVCFASIRDIMSPTGAFDCEMHSTCIAHLVIVVMKAVQDQDGWQQKRAIKPALTGDDPYPSLNFWLGSLY
ncbi:hypothetical protein E4U10_004983 [Claviceps purpurea]|nr:hypothetical protein E4U11_005226 [Claviceps purpurea]KAG6189425.1 hypothetical protein E4U10_004983 [Claviceps purpurea]